LFAGAMKLSVVQKAVFHLSIVLYFDETTFTLVVFLKAGQGPESGECKVKPRGTL